MNNNHLTQDDSLKCTRDILLENGSEKQMDLPEEINEIEYENFKEYFEIIISFSAQTGDINIEWVRLLKILEIKIKIVTIYLKRFFENLTQNIQTLLIKISTSINS
jgi:hypothetical protein